MLELDKVDLEMLGEALEDHSPPEEKWWFDPATGAVEFHPGYEYSGEGDDDPELLEKRGLVPIYPTSSRESYGDLRDFTLRVRDPRARDRLERAIEGRGAFRRFKDTLFDFPELREVWFSFHDARLRVRAIEWLRDEGFIDDDQAERAIAEIREPDLPEISGPFDPFEIARAVANDLKELYGDRLRDVILFGSWARGDAHPESDIDLLVVLDQVDSTWDEHKRMDDILWRHSLENTTVVIALPVSAQEFAESGEPLLMNVRREGTHIR